MAYKTVDDIEPGEALDISPKIYRILHLYSAVLSVDPGSGLIEPEKPFLNGRTSGRSITLSATPSPRDIESDSQVHLIDIVSVCFFTVPKYNDVNFMLMRTKEKSRSTL